MAKYQKGRDGIPRMILIVNVALSEQKNNPQYYLKYYP